MLKDILKQTEEKMHKAVEVVRGKLARKEKVSGFGHRVYRTEDPRATHLRTMSRDLGQLSGALHAHGVSPEKIERIYLTHLHKDHFVLQ